MKRVTLKDIARETGLTVNSVSHALNDKSDISPATKERVAEAAKRLGYVPNLAASALKKGKSRTLAIVFDNLFNPYYNIMTHYLANAVSACGYDFLTVVEKDGDRLNAATYRNLLARNVDGILSFLEPDKETAKILRGGALPVTMIGRYCELKNIDYIYADDVRGGYAAAEYLISKGAKRLHYLADRMSCSCARERFQGFLECVKEKGVRYSSSEMGNRPYYEVIEKVMEEIPDCDGFVCFNDYIAIEAQYVASRLRPELKVVGYDDIKEEVKLPGLFASVAIDKEGIAIRAVELLLDRIEGGYSGKGRKVIMPVHIAEYAELKDRAADAES